MRRESTYKLSFLLTVILKSTLNKAIPCLIEIGILSLFLHETYRSHMVTSRRTSAGSTQPFNPLGEDTLGEGAGEHPQRGRNQDALGEGEIGAAQLSNKAK